MTALTYSTFVAQIAEMAAVEPTQADFLAIIPSMINYAELRILRDLDMMFTSTALSGPSYVLSPGNRNITFSQDLSDGGSFVVCEQINLITPAGQTNPDAATRVPLLPVTKEFLDAVCGSSLSANRTQPKYFAPFNEDWYIVGPVPDVTYYVEVVGTYRPASLSATNTSTFLSKYLPDLLVMASMIYISAFQRNFGRQSDDPQMAVSYEAQYTTLLKGAAVEEARKKFESSGWTSQSPAVVASPSRG